MDQDTIHDLKQFISATVSQQTTGLRTELKADISSEIKNEIRESEARITQLIEQVAAGTNEIIQTNIDYNDTRFDDHENRLTRLEHKPA